MSDIQAEVNSILAKIKEARQYSNPYNAQQLFFIAEDLMVWLAWLIHPLFEAETAYRQKVHEYHAGGMSMAGAEARAKAEPEYQFYRKLSYVYDLADEQIKLIKKFSDKLTDEQKRG